jgi:hypothetical protein
MTNSAIIEKDFWVCWALDKIFSLDPEHSHIIFKGGYEGTPTSYNIGEMVQKVLEDIQKKSEKYGRPSSPIHLLLHSTDSRFFLRSEVLDLLALRISRHNHVFSTIKYVSPDDGILEHVFPRPADSFSGFNENVMAVKIVLFANIPKAQVQPDGTVIIPMHNPLSQG